ncbi:unnamed protein product [Thelazia callipaeda]|uniref:Kinesin-like protein n=1 Tax=Thelazia callipaeda TaxID=103827 RepID=A0A0N5CVL5_THECL|nr:unnamed protein product [Thelazia callipaeda]
MLSAEKNLKTGKNVRVAVRIRPMNDNEITDKARCAVTSNTRKRTVTFCDRGINKEFGPFDKVYGPHARQLDIYIDLVEPLVKNALAGYNCTLFAYGQTSTGKTFTMEGETSGSLHEYSWNEDSSLGIVPRALHHIFNELENEARCNDVEEFSVRVSYVELYNEELYDLLGNAELGHTRLRLFEDSVRKGSVIVSGLEEVPVTDRHEVCELLKRGAEKRRTAATQMNLNSSRSHTVFTITVVIRENTVSEEEVIKQGKLSLIDLAGSENIGRSGSVDKRAREAGSINQSLLTLGRVIMALTTGASHVPYRESKLTRILQDSLGGRTITTIVATMSPASTSIEESISTLEYASSAKNIKNQPEINQKLTHRALLKAYNEEMNRLMRDLQAARDKNGFFIDRQNYDNLNTQIAQQNLQIESLSDELQSVMERVQLHMEDSALMSKHYGRLYERYKHMEKKYKEYSNENAAVKLELANCKSKLENHKLALKKLQESAIQSQAENKELRKNCTDLTWKLNKAFDKIDVFQNAASENENHYIRCTADSAENANKLRKGIQDWNNKLQFQLQQMTEQCERAKLDFGKEIVVFQDCVKSLRFQLKTLVDFTDGDNSLIVNFLDKVHLFTVDAENSYLKMHEQYSRFADFIAHHTQIFQQLGEDFYAVSDNYVIRTISCAEEMKNKITDIMEAYIKTTKEDALKTYEELETLKNRQQRECKEQHTYIKTVAEEILSDKSVWEALRGTFSARIDAQSERVKKTYKAMEVVCNDLEKQGDVVSALCNGMASSSISAAMHQVLADMSASLSTEVSNALSRTKQLVENEVVRPLRTGETPKREEPRILPEPVEIPSASDLINENGEDEVPRRLSQYRSRDSILEAPFAVLSPGALKDTLKCDLDDIKEVSENSGEYETEPVGKRSIPTVNITKRRRAFQNKSD